MNVAVFQGRNEGTISLAVVARDLAEALEGGYVASVPRDLKGADWIITLPLDQTPVIEANRRYIGYGKQLLFFTGSVTDFGPEALAYYLLFARKFPLLVHSHFHRAAVTKELGVFSPAVQREIQSNLTLIPYGIREWDFVSTGTNSRDVWMVPYNRFNEVQKQSSLLIELLNKALIKLPQVRVEYYLTEAYQGRQEKKGLDTSRVEFLPCPPTREEYLGNLQQAGMFLSTSKTESFGMMYLELLFTGSVGVFLDYPWVRMLLPDYPFVVGKRDAVPLLLTIYHDFETAQQVVREYLHNSGDRYHLSRFLKQFRTYMEAL